MISARDILEAARRSDALDAADLHLLALLGASAAPRDAEGDAALIAVAAALCRVCAEGSLCVSLEKGALGAALEGLFSAAEISADAGDVAALATRFLADADTGRHDAVLGTPEAPRPLVRAHGNLYWHRFAFAEKTVALELARRLRTIAPLPGDTLAEILRDTLDAHPLRKPDGSALALNALQREALATALRVPVFVLSGGPGTGKTTWTAAWLRAVLRMPGVAPGRVRLCAPTGRAARRLAESLHARLGTADAHSADASIGQVPITTLHALLGYRASEGRFARGPGDPIDADWILLDEASMADVFLLAALMRALRPGARLVLTGDPDQLPAVEAGSVLAELLPEHPGGAAPVPSVTLDEGHRARGAVAALSAAVRAGDSDRVLAALGAPAPEHASVENFFASAPPIARLELPPSDAQALESLLGAYAAALFGVGRGGAGDYETLLHRFRALRGDAEAGALDALWERAGRTRVLSPLRRGPVGAERANRLLRGLVERRWRLPGDARGAGFHGAPILVTRNDERTGLSNGDVGLWLETQGGAAVFFPDPARPQGWQRVPAALLPPHQLGFASTVHKSQGSEYDTVLVLLPEPGNRLLARETLYTAITRARDSVRIAGAEAAIREAVEKRLRRFSGLRHWFADAAKPEPDQG